MFPDQVVKPCAPFRQRPFPKIAIARPQKVERIKDQIKGTARDRAAQRAKIGSALLVLNNDLAIDDGNTRRQFRRSRYDPWIAVAPVEAVPRERPGNSILYDELGTITVILQLVLPQVAFRRLVDGREKLRLDEP